MKQRSSTNKKKMKKAYRDISKEMGVPKETALVTNGRACKRCGALLVKRKLIMRDFVCPICGGKK